MRGTKLKWTVVFGVQEMEREEPVNRVTDSV